MRGHAIGVSYDHLEAVQQPTEVDIAWAAGFLEGEGSFYSGRGSQYVSATQVNAEPLGKMKRLFGGSVYLRGARGNSQEYFLWRVSGSKARGLMFKLFPLLSEKRQGQIRKALGEKEPTEE